jgi:hypothetical protein
MDKGETMRFLSRIFGSYQKRTSEDNLKEEIHRKISSIYVNGIPCTITDPRTGKRIVGRHITDDTVTKVWSSVGEGLALVMIDVQDLPYQPESPEPVPGGMMVTEFVYYEVDIADVQYYSG